MDCERCVYYDEDRKDQPCCGCHGQNFEEADDEQREAFSCGHEKGGEWIVHRDPFDICATEFVCSACRESFCSSELTDDEFLEMMKYCPNCGAKMKGGDQE